MREGTPIRHSLSRFRTSFGRRHWILWPQLLDCSEIAFPHTRLAAGITIALALCAPRVFAAKDPIQTITPIQAELMADMNARLLKVGAVVYARVTVEWQGTDCFLRNGAILEGHVLSVTPYRQNAKISEVGIAFTRAQCGEPKMGAFELLLAALAAPPQNSDLGILTAPLPFSTSAGKSPDSGWQSIAALGVMQQGAILNLQLDMAQYKFPLTPRMRMGEVDGIKGLRLDVATGPEDSSVLTSRGHDVSLEKHTLLLLVPARGVLPRGPEDADRSASARVARDISTLPSDVPAGMSAPPPVDDLDSCAPPQCNVALPPGTASDGAKPAASISIRELGYAPRSRREVRDFDQDEVLAYLSPKELLVTFNPHLLVPRHALGQSGSTVRVIRASLVDTETLRVTRTVDWELPDNREYLWPLSEGRVLVHVGSELRVYGEGLNILNRIPLEGPLNFVRVTPDGSFVALGVTHERHSPELHAQLAASLDREPEEDVEVLVLNRNFETIARSSTQSGLVPPTLLDEGQARLLAQPNMRYRVSMLTWDNQASTLVRFNSACTPEISTLTPDLIFLESCDKQTRVLQYRVLHSNGKLALKGGSNPNDFDHAAKGSTDRQAFVVKTVQSNGSMIPGDQFSAADLSSEELEVYRATDGKRLLGVRVSSPSASRDGYALAPDSSELAVLTRDQISIYSVGKN
jgi:hypothetical protein